MITRNWKMKRVASIIMPLLIMAFYQNTDAQLIRSQTAQAERDTLKAHLKKAQLLARQGNTDEASKIYLNIMEKDPDSKEAVMGWLIANMKKTITGEEDAIKSLGELSGKYPGNTGILFLKAFLELEYNHYEEALRDIDRLIGMQPDSAINYLCKGQVLEAMGKNEEALTELDRATSLAPGDPDNWSNKSGVLSKLGRYDEAIISSTKAIELSPSHPIIIYNRACIYCIKGDKANALADLQKAISINPSFRNYAPKDENFRTLFDDEDFKKLTR
jgi:tetratricopeptide (TPR) repeat protein